MENIGSMSIFKTNLTLESPRPPPRPYELREPSESPVLYKFLLQIALSVIKGRKAYHLCISVVAHKTSFVTIRVKLLSL